MGVPPEYIVIGHACYFDNPLPSVLIRISERGAFVGFDRVTDGWVDDTQKVVTILASLKTGHADKLPILSDFTGRRSEARPGYGIPITVFSPFLREVGVDPQRAGRHSARQPVPRFLPSLRAGTTGACVLVSHVSVPVERQPGPNIWRPPYSQLDDRLGSGPPTRDRRPLSAYSSEHSLEGVLRGGRRRE